MDKQLSYYLAKKYSKIFPQRNKLNTYYWSFECGNGWFNIINDVCDTIQNHVDFQQQQYNDIMLWKQLVESNKIEDLPEWIREKHLKQQLNELIDNIEEPRQPVALQVKEKYATLQIYIDYYDGHINSVLSIAENLSEQTCEICGKLGKLREGSWLKTLCDMHAEERVANQKKPVIDIDQEKISNIPKINIDDVIDVLCEGGLKPCRVSSITSIDNKKIIKAIEINGHVRLNSDALREKKLGKETIITFVETDMIKFWNTEDQMTT